MTDRPALLAVAALLGLLSAVSANGQTYTPAELDRLRARAIGPMLDDVTLVAFGRGCHILGPAGNEVLEGQYRWALDVLGERIARKSLRVLGRWEQPDLDAYTAAQREGARRATPAACAAMRPDPDHSLDIKRVIEFYQR